MTTTNIKPDSRFFPGYIWVSDDPDGRFGLCIKAECCFDALRAYLKPQMQYWNKGRTLTAYAWNYASDTPQRLDVVVQ